MGKAKCDKTAPDKGRKDKFECRQCGLSAIKDKHLCKPKKIKTKK